MNIFLTRVTEATVAISHGGPAVQDGRTYYQPNGKHVERYGLELVDELFGRVPEIGETIELTEVRK